MSDTSARKQRAVKVTDSEWEIVRARVKAARMSVSGYVLCLAQSPEWPSGLSRATLSARLDGGAAQGCIATAHGPDTLGHIGGRVFTMKKAQPVYCRTPADWDRIRTRAKSVGKSVSEFVMTCALHDSTPASTVCTKRDFRLT